MLQLYLLPDDLAMMHYDTLRSKDQINSYGPLAKWQPTLTIQVVMTVCMTIQESPIACYTHILVPKVTADTPWCCIHIRTQTDAAKCITLLRICAQGNNHDCQKGNVF